MHFGLPTPNSSFAVQPLPLPAPAEAVCIVNEAVGLPNYLPGRQRGDSQPRCAILTDPKRQSNWSQNTGHAPQEDTWTGAYNPSHIWWTGGAKREEKGADAKDTVGKISLGFKPSMKRDQGSSVLVKRDLARVALRGTRPSRF